MVEGHKRQSHTHRSDLAGEYRWGDTGQLVFLVVFIVGLIVDLFLLKVSLSWQDVVPLYIRIVLFVLLLSIAAYFTNRAHTKVFKEQRKTVELIDSSVFGIIRHPMYFGTIVLYVAFVVLSLSVVGCVICCGVIIFYYYLCCYEEAVLVEQLGNVYVAYKKSVPMLLPFTKIKKP